MRGRGPKTITRMANKLKMEKRLARIKEQGGKRTVVDKYINKMVSKHLNTDKTIEELKSFLIKLYYDKPHCPICAAPFTLLNPRCLYHDHTTNQLRGFLCRTCNAGIGMFKDNPAYLENAADYIRTFQIVETKLE